MVTFIQQLTKSGQEELEGAIHNNNLHVTVNDVTILKPLKYFEGHVFEPFAQFRAQYCKSTSTFVKLCSPMFTQRLC